jgi:hypothetical protein
MMQHFFDYLEKAKDQSPKVKQRIAFLVSFFIILVIISVWLPLRDSAEVERADSEYKKVTPSSEETTWNETKFGFRKVVNALQTLKDFKQEK